ncbi:MAG TPA: hypothetical protein VEW69_07335 [Alphaproteobacteria bacterium]|nr:hypothetical protein [Alphaproteobacteria bacterium]
MRSLLAILTLLVCLSCPAEKKHARAPRETKAAAQDFQRAQELEKTGRLEEAFQAAMDASRLDPSSSDYMTARELLRQQVVNRYLENGNRLAQAGYPEAARGQFNAALSFDPENLYLQQRLRDVAPAEDGYRQHVLEMLAMVEDVEVKPSPGVRSFHLRGSPTALYQEIGKAFGITMQFDPTLVPRALRFDVDDVDFNSAMALAGKVTHTFWAPMSETLAVVANDTPEMRNQYERMATATLRVSEAISPSEVNDLLLLLRNVLDVKYMAVLPPKNLINIRAPKEQMDMIIASLDSVLQPRPEVMLDVKAYEYDTDRVRQAGLNLPLDFEIFSITSELRRVLGSSAQSVIDQFEKTGTIDPSTIDPSVLSNLQGSPLLKPFVFFGKGLGLTGITVPTNAGASFSASGSVVRNLENVTLRGADGEPSTFRLGSRVPILNGTFTSITLDAKNNATIGSTPSIQYEDLGVTLKSTPHLHSGENVTLNLELQLKSLGTQTFNDIPEISTREFKGTVTVKDGEPAIITGLLTEQETYSTSGAPGLAQIPGLRRITGANGREVIHNEILVVVTPHIVRKLFPESGTLGSSR